MTALIISLARKPVSEPTVAQNVATWGSGALNIDPCRIGVTQIRNRTDSNDGWKRPSSTTGEIPVYRSSHGRWPPNLFFAHLEDCTITGTKKVSGHRGYPNGPKGNTRGIYGGFTGTNTANEWEQAPLAGFADEDGLETVTTWCCAPGCPVGALDQQSGERPGAVSFSRPKNYGASSYQVGDADLQPGYGDTGTASRFFPQFGRRQ